MSVYEQAKKYYPRLWPLDRLKALLAADKLTQAEYTELTGLLNVPSPETSGAGPGEVERE